VLLDEVAKLKNPIISGMEPKTFQFVALRLDELSYRTVRGIPFEITHHSGLNLFMKVTS
jgi:hypothetical protein